jgi:indolepyruvate ferredoxin oxidoreductase, beta subunit
MTEKAPRRISIAILALGGQGGGVLADWILSLGSKNGWHTQGTSVPGVAQRTGSTVYYIEMFPETAAGAPVFALMPVSGDVDVVITSELMEAGRAILRGFVSEDRTTLISSLHRIYAISEKIAMGSGAQSSERILQAAQERARHFIGFDMDKVATQSGSVISSVMLGALAGSGALPFGRGEFEDIIRSSGISVESNLRGFGEGFDAAKRGLIVDGPEIDQPPLPTTEQGKRLAHRVQNEIPAGAQRNAVFGVQRLMDYQDAAYADLYLDRLRSVVALDDGTGHHVLTSEAARHLALWMAYDDIIRVADLKVRSTRIARVRDEVKAQTDQIVDVTEFMHPRLREVCDLLPPRLGQYVLKNSMIGRIVSPLFSKGRHVRTTSIFWFLSLNSLAGLRRWRRGTLRYAEEQARIDDWLKLVLQAAATDISAAEEIVACQRLIKGYGDTYDRGLRNFNAAIAIWPKVANKPGAADAIRSVLEAALADEAGIALGLKLEELALESG